ncbi:MAG TPA: hypothetical protein VN643_03730 [Pyrinomonadaceae bacterium]|nr:hypothetical protein [Pyrinomonadaceae bacterium]
MLKDDAGGGQQQQFATAGEEFQALLREAWPSPEAELAVTNAYAAYAAILQEPWQSSYLNERSAAAYEQYRTLVHEVFTGRHADQVIDAYRQYARHLKNAWANLDPEFLGPEDLVAIARGMTWIAGVTFEVSAGRLGVADSRS